MTHKSLFSISILVCMLWTTVALGQTPTQPNSAQDVVVGNENSSSTTTNAPVVNNSSYWASILYTQPDINKGGVINKLSFKVANNPSCTRNIKIYMRETNLYDMHEKPAWLAAKQPIIGDYTLVYNGQVAWANGWTEIQLQTPFVYTNQPGQHFEIYTTYISGTNCGTAPTFVSESKGNNSSLFPLKYKGTNSTGTNINSTLSTYAKFNNQRPVIKLNFSSNPNPIDLVKEVNPKDAHCGNSSSGIPVPVKYDKWGTYNYTWTAQVYPKGTFAPNDVDKITAIEFYADNCGSPCSYSATQQKIYLGHMNGTTFTDMALPTLNNNTGNSQISDLTEVYSGNVTYLDGKWNKITFATPFIYDKTKDIVVVYTNEHNDDATASGGIACLATPTFIIDNNIQGNMLYAHNGSTLENTADRKENKKPIIKFHTTLKPQILPVELLHFQAKSKGAVNQLTWSTASEINNSHFEVERSENGKDFEKIGKVAGVGNSTITQDYTFEDAKPTNIAYYRLKQVDIDGKYEYSETVWVVRENATFAVINVQPNPTKSIAQLSFNSSQKSNLDWTVTDFSGRKIQQGKALSKRGINTLDVDMSALANGVYFITLNNGAKTITTRVVKAH